MRQRQSDQSRQRNPSGEHGEAVHHQRYGDQPVSKAADFALPIGYRTAAAGIILAAYALRLHHLGSDSLWFDEAGQALAALMPTLGRMIEVERTHVMAMPLDYLITRIAGAALHTSEFALRFPSAFWGVLTVALVFAYLTHCGKPAAGLAAAALLALSATHIRYSQEVRFYASLAFFYLLSTYLLFKALDTPSARNIAIVSIVASIGAYFHPFVLLALLNGYVYVLMSGRRIHRKASAVALVTISAILFLTFLPAYLYFDRPRSPRGLLEVSNGASLVELVGRGLEWGYTPLGVALLALAVVGVLSLRPRQNPHDMIVAATFVGLLAQIPAIIAADWFKGYFFASRQVFHLLPIAMILAGIGFVRAIDLLVTYAGAIHIALPRSVMTWGLSTLIAALAAVELVGYYDANRSDGREVAQQMISEQVHGDCVLVTPFYETGLYEYYLTHRFDRPDILGDLRPVYGSLADAITVCPPEHRIYLATSRKLRDRNQDDIRRLGFVLVDLPESQELEGAHYLYKLASGS